MAVVIKAENISKLYRLGVIGTGSLAQDAKRWWAKLQGKGDPFLKIGTENVINETGGGFVWALRNIDFEVEQGQVLGIIGKNGAGKSTLLKILTKITAPTTGTVKMKGRVSSLLEVGTGFHPDLTGRENLYLNGAILGMNKAEIRKKFDEIVDFSGVEKYIDTPVKRYSSGMYVRLAFAVAAHLEPDILIVDEVLAVGDAEFQRKCLGKIKNVSGAEGRTVLFVSHNMSAISDLCSVCMFLKQGHKAMYGNARNVIDAYMHDFKRNVNAKSLKEIEDRIGSGAVRFSSYSILNEKNEIVDHVYSGQNIKIVLNFENFSKTAVSTLLFSITVVNEQNVSLFHLSNIEGSGQEFRISSDTQNWKVTCRIDDLPLPAGDYFMNFYCSDKYVVFDDILYGGKLQVKTGNFFGTGKTVDSRMSAVLVKSQWNIETG